MVTAMTSDITDDTVSLNKFHYAQVCIELQFFQITNDLSAICALIPKQSRLY